MVHLNYRDTRPIYLQIVENYKLQIRSGILENGEKLPSDTTVVNVGIVPEAIEAGIEVMIEAACMYDKEGLPTE